MDNYRYVRLKGEDAVFFKGLDPYEKLRLTRSNAGFAIGVLKGEDKELQTVGLLCGIVFSEAISIEWLAVDPMEQDRGIGENLLLRVFALAKRSGMDVVCAIIPKEYEKEAALKNAETFFEERLFNKKSIICADVEGILSELDSGAGVKDITAVPMSSLDSNEVYKELAPIENATYSIDYKEIRSQIDGDVSFVIRPSGRIEGALLVQKAGNILIPVYHYARNEKISTALIHAVVDAAVRKYGKKTPLYITARQKETGNLIKKVYGKTSEATLFTANLSDYDRETRYNEKEII